MLSSLGAVGLHFDDFTANGILLPATEQVAMEVGLPLHRGPHRIYNELVLERVGAVEMEWSRNRLRDERGARDCALLRIGLIQRALKRRLSRYGNSALILNRRDPIGRGVDYTSLDAMADTLWGAAGPNA